MIAIGDIHGCLDALNALIDVVEPGPEDTVVALGDYIDRGPDSKGGGRPIVGPGGEDAPGRVVGQSRGDDVGGAQWIRAPPRVAQAWWG